MRGSWLRGTAREPRTSRSLSAGRVALGILRRMATMSRSYRRAQPRSRPRACVIIATRAKCARERPQRTPLGSEAAPGSVLDTN